MLMMEGDFGHKFLKNNLTRNIFLTCYCPENYFHFVECSRISLVCGCGFNGCPVYNEGLLTLKENMTIKMAKNKEMCQIKKNDNHLQYLC